MPTFARAARFDKDWSLLDEHDQERFKTALRHFIEDVEAGRFRPGLRVRGVQGTPGVFEMTWAPDGRATWQYGEQRYEGVPHVVWRRIGTHDAFRSP
jgi:hypothetical protein